MNEVITCTRRLEWDAMHRVPNHGGKCKSFHGHRYIAEITCGANNLDDLGMVIDFGLIKSIIGTWIDENWDHTAIFMESDSDPTIEWIARSNAIYCKPVYFLKAPPTAENIASELARVSVLLLNGFNIKVEKVTVWETPNCYATWTCS